MPESSGDGALPFFQTVLAGPYTVHARLFLSVSTRLSAGMVANLCLFAGMDILCSDKTGTLTLNKLTVENQSVFPFGNYKNPDVLKYAALSAQRNSEEAIDVVCITHTAPVPTCSLIACNALQFGTLMLLFAGIQSCNILHVHLKVLGVCSAATLCLVAYAVC